MRLAYRYGRGRVLFTVSNKDERDEQVSISHKDLHGDCGLGYDS